MAAKKNPKVTRRIAAKARQVLKYAEERAKTAKDWVELHNAIFGIGGKATELFTTEPERGGFLRTVEHKRIGALMDTLPGSPVKGVVEMIDSADEAISVRLPRSVHAALLAESKAEEVSLNQLCVAKLVAHLRAVI